MSAAPSGSSNVVKRSETVHLGDGLYVELSGGMVRLFTERATGVHEVYLDAYVLESFIDWLKALEILP
jgi:hypothetical protein